MLDLFVRRPECKTSISPNNIYLLREGDKFRDPPAFLLIDPGTTLNKNYDGFTFHKYWNEVLPDRIRKYERTGYLQWVVPQDVTKSERDEAREFDIFRGLTPSEVLVLLKFAKTVEFDPQETIIMEGAVGESFYLILDGEVELKRRQLEPCRWNLRMGRGSVVGEMGFLLRVPRSMTVVAATPCKLIEIEDEAFDELLTSNLTAPFKLIHNIAVSLAERLHALDNRHEQLHELIHSIDVRLSERLRALDNQLLEADQKTNGGT
jgi:CRP-like cAMP-binding protein